MIPFRRVVVVGAGLVGGSWALALRRAGFDGELVALDPTFSSSAGNPDSLGHPFDVVRRRSLRRDDAHAGDLVVLATPVGTTINLLTGVARAMPVGVTLTDVASTKSRVCAAWAHEPSGAASFVGGHPMAGAEGLGISAARADLFDGEAYFLVRAPGAAFAKVCSTVCALGARPVVIDPADHDRAVALTSHAPQLLATALQTIVARSELADLPGGPAYREIARLASSPWSTWSDIVTTNDDEIAAALGSMIDRLTWMRTAIMNGRIDDLADAFGEANRLRR